MDNNELQHWGVLGMKWGVRRYQNKDGTLTAAGRKRYDKEKAKLEEREKVVKNKLATQAKMDKLSTKRKQLDEMERSLSGKKTKGEDSNVKTTTNNSVSKTSRQNKPLSQMTDSELKDLASRYENMTKINKYLKEQSAANESKGKKFIKKVFNKVVMPTVEDYAKNKFRDYFNSKVNKESPKKPKSNNSNPTPPKVHRPSGVFRRVTVDDVVAHAPVYLSMGRSVIAGVLPERSTK